MIDANGRATAARTAERGPDMPMGFFRRLAILLFCLTIVRPPALSAQDVLRPAESETVELAARWPAEFLEDANLYDVCFVDARLGWAVGDRGVIWQTQDGGQTWSRQESTVRCRLESVSFVDAKRGWAVGGETAPYTHRPIGVILKTEDGGVRWKRQSDALLPWLKGVRFSQRQQGYAYGWPSTMFPSGLFRTTDGGQHWSAVSGHAQGWVGGDMDPNGSGLLIERNGHLSHLAAGELRRVDTSDKELRLPVSILHMEPGEWILCGNQGLVSITKNDGQSWQHPTRLPPAPLLQEFDWQSVARVGSRIWIAGVPGTQILHSTDHGRTFSFQPTGQRLPIFKMTFTDADHGWAVGAMGLILHTADGGRSWKPQRGDQRRLSVMGIFARSSDIPWECVAQLTSVDGHRLSLELLSDSSAHQTQLGSVALNTRLHEATVWAGGIGASLLEGLAIPDQRLKLSEATIRQRWNDLQLADLDQPMTDYLVRQLRIWQPDIIVTPEIEADSNDGWNILVHQMVTQAVEKAQTSLANTRSMEDIGLSPWQVNRVAYLTTGSSRSGYSIHGQRVALARSQTVGVLADQAHAHLASFPRTDEQVWSLRGFPRSEPGREGRNEFRADQSAVSLAGGATRRQLHSFDSDVRRENQRLQQQRHVESLMRKKSEEGLAASTQILHLANDLDAEARGQLLFQMGSHFLSIGQSEATFACWLPFYEELAEHPLAEAARLQLFWLLASEEASLHWRFTSTRPVQHVAQTTMMEVEDGQVRSVTFEDPDTIESLASAAAGTNSDLQQATASDLPRDAEAQQRPQVARRFADLIQSRQPDLHFEPELGFPLAALQRRTQQRDAAVRFWKNQLAGRTPPAYRSWAGSELALAGERPLQTRPLWNCPLIDKPPHLDGQIDEDPAWTQVTPQALRPSLGLPGVKQDADRSTTQVWIAYDRQFLYLAARCDESTGDLLESSSDRQRDQPLVHDRLEIALDVDRDGRTFWQLAVDYRGWASDQLMRDMSWNPTWYIARHATNQQWSVEAAVELSSLTSQPVETGTAWCLGLQRVVPGDRFETWIQPPPVELRPQEFGLLLFE